MNAEITRYIYAIRDEIVAHYYAMKLNASGEFDRGTQVEEYPGGIKIVSPQHIYQMEDGRRPGTMPPVSAIRQWIKDKNANAGTDIPEEAAFAIAYVFKRFLHQHKRTRNRSNNCTDWIGDYCLCHI